jgi:hypothetical protein
MKKLIISESEKKRIFEMYNLITENVDQELVDYGNNYIDSHSCDEIYNDLQSPLLLAVLYFLFQLPIFKKLLFKYFSVLFSKDGNYNINGYLFTSVLFGLLFYLLSKLTIFFNTF